MPSPRKPLTGTALAIIAAVLWSTVATAFKLSLKHASAPQLLAGASTVSTLALGCVLLARGELKTGWPSSARAAWFSLGLGALNPFLYYVALFEAYARLPAQVALPLNYTWALTLTLFSVLFLKHKPRKLDWLGILLGYLGVAVLSVGTLGPEKTRVPLLGTEQTVGIVLALVSAILWASYWIGSVRDTRPPTLGLFQNFVLALPLVWSWSLYRDGLASWGTVFADVRAVLAITYVGLFEMGVTFVVWQLALKRSTSVAQSSTVIFLTPVLSLLLIYLILREPLLPGAFVGLGLILGGVALQRRQDA